MLFERFLTGAWGQNPWNSAGSWIKIPGMSAFGLVLCPSDRFYRELFLFFSLFHRKPAPEFGILEMQEIREWREKKGKMEGNPPVLHPIGIWLSSCHIGSVKSLLEIKTSGSEASPSHLRLGLHFQLPRNIPMEFSFSCLLMAALKKWRNKSVPGIG